MKRWLTALIAAFCFLALAFSLDQISYFNQGFLRQGSAALDRAYLGITNGSGGSGTVTVVSAGTLSPLFTTSVGNPTTTPAISFSQISQSQNLVFASPNGSSGVPTFRALVAADLPGGGGTVTSVSSGNADPLFTITVANPTTTPAFSFTQESESQNLVYASPNGSSGSPTFRSLLLADVPFDNVTNASWPNSSDISEIASSNYPTVALKSFSAGANVTLTDQGTNIVIASTGGSSGGGTSLDLFAWETNYITTYRNVAGDVANNAAIAFNGFGDSFTPNGNGTSAIIQSTDTTVGQGPWGQITSGGTSGNVETFGTTTANTIFPYAGGGFQFQTFVKIRNTNNVRLWIGFFAGSFGQYETVDTIKTNTVAFRYSTAAGDGTWKAFTSDGTNTTLLDTGVALTTDGNYFLQFIRTNGITNIVFNVNRTAFVTATTNTPYTLGAGLGNATMGVGYIMDTLATGNKTNWIHYFGYTVDWPFK